MEILSNYQGSETTKSLVEQQIRERWGDSAAREYDPYRNCLPYSKWLEQNRKVRRGEKAIKSYVFITKADENGEVIKRWPKKINLFYHLQTEKVE